MIVFSDAYEALQTPSIKLLKENNGAFQQRNILFTTKQYDSSPPCLSVILEIWFTAVHCWPDWKAGAVTHLFVEVAYKRDYFGSTLSGWRQVSHLIMISCHLVTDFSITNKPKASVELLFQYDLTTVQHSLISGSSLWQSKVSAGFIYIVISFYSYFFVIFVLFTVKKITFVIIL